MKYILIVITLFSFPLMAQSANTLEVDNMDIRSARKFYKGGVDEEDLQVQKEFRAPYRVINLKMTQKKVRESLLKAVNENDSEKEESEKENQ